MTGVAGQRPMMPPCPKCAGLGGVCYLTCATLRLHGPLRCVYCGCWSYRPGWGCSRCGTCTVEDVAAIEAREAVTVPP